MSIVLNTDKEKTKKEKDLEYQKARDHEKVRGIFRFYEIPGGILEFNYLKYKGDSLEPYKLRDGEAQEVPRMVAIHLNKSGTYPVHVYSKDELGNPIPIIGKSIKRYGFHSLEFLDIDDLGIPANSLSAIR